MRTSQSVRPPSRTRATVLALFLLLVSTRVAAAMPLQALYLEALQPLVDQLVSTQITDPDDPDYGALVSPSTNPQPHPRHSRAAEAVYPLAVAYRHTRDERFRNAAILLGNWLVGIQQDNGAWGENWPNHDGWNGTTADQLISLAGALDLLREELDASDRQAWDRAISRAADFSLERFYPGSSNINYIPTAAVGLVLAHRAVESPRAAWLDKAEDLIAHVTSQINADNFIVGEGKGVDLGYNIAQTIGFIAWYGILQETPQTVELAASLLKTHQHFMYPNGAIDNSWGTRSFKWTLESGTKTAPGVHFTFGLLADQDPSLHRGARLALDWLENHALDDKNRVVYGPHAYLHENSNPPSNYGTFARAQSIATAIEYGPEATELAPIPAEQPNWVRFFPTTQTAVLRTEKVMATLTAYANNLRYPLESAVRGGSTTVVWWDGYGPDGFLQLSSQTVYRRIEQRHMPDGIDPLPLTPRIETASGPYATNLFDPDAALEVAQSPTAIEVISSGALRTMDGDTGPTFTWTHAFSSDSYRKTVEISSAAGVQVVEPFVDNPGNHYALDGDDTFVISAADGRQWQLKVESSSVPYTLSHGDQRERYYQPFPGVNAYPVTIRFESSEPATLTYSVSGRTDTAATLQEFDAYLDRTAGQLGDSPFAAVISRNGEILYERYYDGQGVLERPVHQHSRWRVFSITKSFVAALVLGLCQDGLIALDEPVGKYLPAFREHGDGPFDRRAVTIRHLLSHTSGAAVAGNKTPEPLPPSFDRIEILTAPGTAFEYSSLGMLILERTLEAATGKDLGALLREKILEPVGLASTGYVYPGTGTDNVLPLRKDVFHYSQNGRRAGSGLYTTARDLNAFGQFWLSPESIFSRELREEAWTFHGMRESDKGRYGLLWWLLEGDGGYVMSGKEFKINAVIPETKTVVTVIRYPQSRPAPEYNFTADKRAMVLFGKRL